MDIQELYLNALLDHRARLDAHALKLPTDGWSGFLPDPWYQRLFTSTVTLSVSVGNIGKELAARIPTSISVTPAKILLEAGLATTSAITIGSRAAGTRLLEYGEYFEEIPPGGPLILGGEINRLVTRDRGTMSERLGVGIANHIAREILGFTHIVDAKSCIDAQLVRQSAYSVEKSGKTGNHKMPDYCGLSRDRALSFFEAKGTIDITNVADQVKQGKEQLRCVESVSLPEGNGFVIASFISIRENDLSPSSSIHIDDPEGNSNYDSFDRVELLVRLAYAKVLRYAGREDFADMVIDGKAFFDIAPGGKYLDEPFTPVGFNYEGECILIHTPIYKALGTGRQRGQLGLFFSSIDYLPQLTGAQVFANGMAVIPNLGPYYLRQSMDVRNRPR